MRTIKTFIIAHKVAATIIFILMAGVVYWGYGKLTSTTGEPRYVTATVQKGSVISSITGTGQVSASNQVDLKAKASGDVAYLNAVNGQAVGAGAIIAQLDTTDAQKAIRDAQVNVDSAKLSLAKIQEPADQLSTTQAQNAIASANDAKQSAQSDLVQTYESGFNSISNTFLDLPTIIAGLQDMIYGTQANTQQANVSYYTDAAGQYSDQATQLKQDVVIKYENARAAYDRTFSDYKTVTRSSDNKTIESIVSETYATTKAIADSIKSMNNLLLFYEDQLTIHKLPIKPLADTQLSTLNGYTSKTNAHLSDLLTITNKMISDKDAITSADRTITVNNQSLQKLQAGADALDIQSAQLTIRQRENALLDAKQKLADYYIRAPFAGTIAAINIKQSDSVSSGTSVATLITKQKLAEIALNEVDVAKVKSGQKATLTFDAVDGLTISGVVAEINTIGTVTQGVVSYTVKIGFDTQDDRIKPGMSVSAAIIIDMKQDVLTVPNSAIKKQGTATYVEMFDTPIATATGSQGVASTLTPRQQTVEVGLSNDTMTEIISGLKEGDQIITRTITTTQTTTQTAPSLLQGAGGGARGLGR